MNNEIQKREDDAVTIAPHVHTVLFEDEKVRALDVLLKVGDKAEMHWHPRNISYVLNEGMVKITKSDNTVVEVQLTSGRVVPAPEGLHSVENIGTTEIHTIQIEFKD